MSGDSPAYPTSMSIGLTKREDFAKAAMTGLLANRTTELYNEKYFETVAEKSVQLADALIKQLNK